MSEKFVVRHLPGNEIAEQRGRSNVVKTMLSADVPEIDKSSIENKEINIDDITPRFINKYPQNRIDELAQSIRNTNGRLVHPIIIVKASDLPKESILMKEIEKRGKTVNDYKYIIVSGERRYRAWLQLREEESERIKGQLGVKNRFDTITANVLTSQDALHEEYFYRDANNKARKMSAPECVWFIRDRFKLINTDEDKRNCLIEMVQDEEFTGIRDVDPDPAIAAKSFRADEYIRYILKKEYETTDWERSSIRHMNAVAKSGNDKVIDALLEEKLPLREAITISQYPDDIQLELLDVFTDNRELYKEKVKKFEENKKKEKEKINKRITHADTRKELRALLKRVSISKDTLQKYAESLGNKYNRNEVDAVKELEALSETIKKLIENTK